MIKNLFLILLFLCATAIFSCFDVSVKALNKVNKKFSKVIFGSPTNSLNEFENFVKHAKEFGVTHIQIQAEDLPLTWWQMDTPGDPYPAWVITNPGLLKTFIPDVLKKYIPSDDAKKIIAVLEARCAILKKYGLKAAFHSFEPQMLPEKIFIDHPEWRGPRVDHPLRARVKRYSPSIENPEVLALYKESIQLLLEHCPEIEILEFRTNDSGAGISWSKGLYAGPNGNINYKDVEMSKRLFDFFSILQNSAREVGKNLEVHLYNTKESNPEDLVKKMSPGIAIDNYEYPGGATFKNSAGSLLYYRRPFAPAAGIPWPITFLEELESAYAKSSSRLFISIGDRINGDLYFKILKQFNNTPTKDEITRLQLLNKVALMKVGSSNSSFLLDVWLNINHAEQLVKILDTGGTILILGGIDERWITRPIVPFPAELNYEEKDYYRKFQFQARTEKDADNLIDMQAGREFEGQNGRWFVNKIIEQAKSYVAKAQTDLSRLIDGVKGKDKLEYRLMLKRLEVYTCLLNNAKNVVNYQAQLDQVLESKNQNEKRESSNAVEEVTSKPIIETAKAEIENTKRLIEILKSEPENIILDHAANKNEEYQRQLGPDILEQLQKKIEIMNAHWNDYDKLFNPK